jgi:hypothetical protein
MLKIHLEIAMKNDFDRFRINADNVNHAFSHHSR